MSKDTVKKERRKSFFLKEISQMLREITEDEPALSNIIPTRVEFSPGDGMCYVYFTSIKGKEDFELALDVLKLYRPSIRKALSKSRQSRYTPDITFRYDEVSDKSRRMEKLLSEVAEELDKVTE